MKNYNDIIEVFKSLTLKDYLEIEVPNNNIEIPLVLEKARYRFIGNIYIYENRRWYIYIF